MKTTISVLCLILSSSAMAENKITPVTKTLSSITVGVEDCRGPLLHEVWAPVIIPSGGEVSVTTSTTTIIANDYFNEIKCTTEETYLQKTTGIDWLGTKKISEIPGSRKRISRVEKVPKSFQLMHTIYEYKFDNLAGEFKRVRNVLQDKASAACLNANQVSQSKMIHIQETACGQ